MARKKHDDIETMVYKGMAEGLRELQRVRQLSDKSMAENIIHRSEATFVGYKYMANGLGMVDLYNLCNYEGICLDRLVGLRKEYNLFRTEGNPQNTVDVAVNLENMLYNIEISGSEVDKLRAAVRCAPWVSKWMEPLRDNLEH